MSSQTQMFNKVTARRNSRSGSKSVQSAQHKATPC